MLKQSSRGGVEVQETAGAGFRGGGGRGIISATESRGRSIISASESRGRGISALEQERGVSSALESRGGASSAH